MALVAAHSLGKKGVEVTSGQTPEPSFLSRRTISSRIHDLAAYDAGAC
jgi:hypothetical protein